jgi:hypothetical protein
MAEPSKAKEAAKWMAKQQQADPDKNIQELIVAAVGQFK